MYISGGKLRACTTSASSLMPRATLQCLPGSCFSLHPLSKGRWICAFQLCQRLSQCWVVTAVPLLPRLQRRQLYCTVSFRSVHWVFRPQCVSSDRCPLSRQRGPFLVAELLTGCHTALLSERPLPRQICVCVLHSKNKTAGGEPIDFIAPRYF